MSSIAWSVKQHIGVGIINGSMVKFDLKQFKSICDNGKLISKLKFVNNNGVVEIIINDLLISKKCKTVFPWENKYDSMDFSDLVSIIYEKAEKQLLLE